MSQRAALQDLDAAIHDAFTGAGFAAVGTYLRKGGDQLTETVDPVRLYVDRATQQMGEFGQSVGQKDAISILLADVPAPAKGAVITFDGESVTLEAMESRDESRERWVVSHV